MLTLGLQLCLPFALLNCSGSEPQAVWVTLHWQWACRQCHKRTRWLGSSPPPCLAADIVLLCSAAGKCSCLADFDWASSAMLTVEPGIFMSGGCWRGPETLAFGFAHVLDRAQSHLVSVGQDSGSDYLSLEADSTA